MAKRRKRKDKTRNLIDRRRRNKSFRLTLDHVNTSMAAAIDDGFRRVMAISDADWKKATDEDPDANE